MTAPVTENIGSTADKADVRLDGKAVASPAKPVKKRMLEQDIAKGIAIILVIALHTLTLKKEIYNILGGLFGFIMPFFFFMAGYNHRPYRYTYKEIVLKRIRQIGVPFLTYSISITLIAGAYYMIAEGCTFKEVVDSYLTLLLTRPFASSIGIFFQSMGWFSRMDWLTISSMRFSCSAVSGSK